MPTYTLEDKDTGEQHEVFMTFSELQEYKQINPNLKQVIADVTIISSKGGRATKIENHPFKEVLQKVGEGHPGSAVDKQHNRRTAKQVATDKIAIKHGIKDV